MLYCCAQERVTGATKCSSEMTGENSSWVLEMLYVSSRSVFQHLLPLAQVLRGGKLGVPYSHSFWIPICVNPSVPLSKSVLKTTLGA